MKNIAATSNQTLTIIVVSVVILLGATLLPACAPTAVQATPTALQESLFAPKSMEDLQRLATQTAVAANSPGLDESEKAIFYVVLPNDRTVPFGKEELGAFQTQPLVVDGQPRDGISVLDVLDQAGWLLQDVKTVSFHGKGSLTLLAGQVTNDMMLVAEENGGVALAAASLPADVLPREIVLIRLE